MLTAEMVKTAQFLGAIALSGGAVFLFLVWWPMLAHTPRPATPVSPAETARRLAQVGAGILLVFAPLDLVRLTRLVADQPLVVTGAGLLWEVAVATRYGQMALVRILIGLIALAVTLIGKGRGKLRAGLLLTLGLGAFASFTLSSHAAATAGEGLWPVIADLVHVAAIALWVGALLLLVTLPWGRLMEERRGQLLLYRATGRIARLALLAVVLLALSGFYLASLRLYGPLAVPETSYGQALAVKVIVMTAILTVAAINRFSLLPKLLWAPTVSRMVGRLLHGLVATEVALAMVALSFAADLTSLPVPEEPPYRTTLHLGADRARLVIPMGQRVRLRLVNDLAEAQVFAVRGMEHQLMKGPGALRHPEMLSYPPPTDRLVLTVPADGELVVEFVPLAPGQFSIGEGQGVLTVVDQVT